jgi:hypothetical protein
MPPQVLIRHLDAEAIRALDAEVVITPYEGEPHERLFLVSLNLPEAPARPAIGAPVSQRDAKRYLEAAAKHERDVHTASVFGAKRLNRLAELDASEGERVRAEAAHAEFLRAEEAMALRAAQDAAAPAWSATIDDGDEG